MQHSATDTTNSYKMLSFKNYLKEEILLEYLTDSQRKQYSSVEMSDQAKNATDHFFGKDNDHVKEDLIDYDHDKSEVHRKIEDHLAQKIDSDSYKKGLAKDKYGRDVKIGRLVNDDKLRNDFANDNTRAGTKSSQGHYVTVVRGTEVAGQTNPKPNAEHPGGHSWRELSCKNIESGVHRGFLKKEITHGTCLARVHDHNGQEIYRATLHPHYNKDGEVAYGVDGEYGIKHPSFTQHAAHVAERLSGELKGDPIFTKDKRVYNDSGVKTMVHPSTTSKHLDDIIKNGSLAQKLSVASHKNISSESLDKLVNHKSENIRTAVAKNPNLSSEHLHKLLSDKDTTTPISALNNPNITPEHIEKALNHPNPSVAVAVVDSKANDDHISKAIDNIQKSNDRFSKIRVGESPKVKGKNLEKLLTDSDTYAVSHVIRKNPNITPDHIDQLSKSNSGDILSAALQHKHTTEKHVEDAFKRNPEIAKRGIVRSSKAKPHHLEHYMGDEDDYIDRIEIAKNKNVSKDQLDRLSKDSSDSVRSAVLTNPNATGDHIHNAITKSSGGYEYEHAAEHPNTKVETLQHIVDSKGYYPEAKRIAKKRIKEMTPKVKKPSPDGTEHFNFH